MGTDYVDSTSQYTFALKDDLRVWTSETPPTAPDVMEAVEENTQKFMDTQAKQLLLYYAQRNLAKKSERSFKNMAEHLLRIQADTYRKRELLAGAAESAMIPEYKPASQVRAEAPQIDRSSGTLLDPLTGLKRTADELDRIVQWLGSNQGNTYETMPASWKELLAEIGFGEADVAQMPRTELINRLRDKSAEIRETAAAFDKLVGEKPDIEDFLDALGERAQAYRADADAYSEAFNRRKQLESIVEKVNVWVARTVMWGVQGEEPETQPQLVDFLSEEDISFLQNELGLEEITNDSQSEILEALETARQQEQDAHERLIDRSFDPVSPDDANPMDGNQFAELMKPFLDAGIGSLERQIEFVQDILDKLSAGEDLTQREEEILTTLGIISDTEEFDPATVTTDLETLLTILQAEADAEDVTSASAMAAASAMLAKDSDTEGVDELV